VRLRVGPPSTPHEDPRIQRAESSFLPVCSTATLFDNVAVTVGGFADADVGVSGFLKVHEAVAGAQEGAALGIQAAAAEGATIEVSLPAVDTRTLRIANVNLEAGFLASEDDIGQIDAALQSVLFERAQLGATIVRLQTSAQNDAIATTNLEAAESAIRDTNIAAATTDLTRDQILVSVGTSVLAQANDINQAVLALFR
jgi:flagellin-like hook-associated protein FlgL